MAEPGANIFFSIVIPTYNSAAVLERALESIVNQTFQSYEVLIMDGVSTDATMNIARAFASANPAIIPYSAPDKGIYDAMNKGIDKAKGKFVYFLGSDDSLSDNGVLQRVYDRVHASDAEFVYGNVRLVGRNLWGKDGQIYDGEFDKKRLFAGNICHQAIFYKKELFARLGYFNIGYTTCADWDLNHRCFAKSRLLYIPETIANFKAGGESTQNTVDDFVRKESVLRLKEYYGTSYFSSLFHTYSWPLWNVSIDYLQKKAYFSSFRFFVYALYHSEKKADMLKSYLFNFFSAHKKRQ